MVWIKCATFLVRRRRSSSVGLLTFLAVFSGLACVLVEATWLLDRLVVFLAIFAGFGCGLLEAASSSSLLLTKFTVLFVLMVAMLTVAFIEYDWSDAVKSDAIIWKFCHLHIYHRNETILIVKFYEWIALYLIFWNLATNRLSFKLESLSRVYRLKL